MLRSLTRWLRGADPAQLDLVFDAPPPPRDADELLARLRAFGLTRIGRCRLTRNRNVMVSYGAGVLRVHEGYLRATPEIWRAIVLFIEGRTRAERSAARRRIVSFTVQSSRPVVRRERTRADDERYAERLRAEHARLNQQHFAGALDPVAIRVSRRMKSRLGHYTAGSNGEAAEIAISRRHLRRHGWDEALHTLLHEMVHQWQDENRHPIDHGPIFRAKARDVGIEPFARRMLAQTQRDGTEKSIGRQAARTS